MKSIEEVLHRKERELQRLQSEIEALRLAARLLNDEEDDEELTRISEHPVEVSRAAVGSETSSRQTPSRQFP